MIFLAALAIFSGLSLNLLLSFAIGAAGAVGKTIPRGETKQPLPIFQFFIMFASVIILWIIFSFVVPLSWRGFSVYFLFFPFSALVCMGLEFAADQMLIRAFPQNGPPRYAKKVFSAFTAYDGLVLAAFFLTFALAGTFSGAVVIGFFFAFGTFISMLILNELRRRSTLERVPRCLRGNPLMLISMGLLSLISASVAGICFRILEALR